jgi:transcriptional regulator with XRE-family HTH domain
MPTNPELEQARQEALVALGHRIRELRLARSMTQQQLADATGLHRVSVNKLEHASWTSESETSRRWPRPWV